jgi:hypothetical protein
MGRHGQRREAPRGSSTTASVCVSAMLVPAMPVRASRVPSSRVPSSLGPSSRGRHARWLGAVVLAAGLWAGQGGVAFAQDDAAKGEAASTPQSEVGGKIEQAKKQIEQLDYTAAQQGLFEVVQSGEATSEELAQAYFNLGVIESALGNDVEATDSFYLALMIQPSILFPEGGSPKIRERLNAARSRVTEVGVLQARAVVRDGVLDVHLDNDPLKLVKRVDVTMTREGGESGKVSLKKGAMRAEVESGVQTIQVVFFDEAGNQLKVLDVDPSGKSEGTTPGGAPIGTPPSVWASWGLWAGVAGALALGGTYFIMEAGSVDDDAQAARNAPNPNPAEVKRLEDNRDRVGTYGVIGLSMAGAAAVTSGALLLFGGHDKPDAEATEASLVPSFAPGHVGAQFSMRF